MSLQSGPEQLMLDLINQERLDAGLGVLTFADTLNDASEDHSSWMLDENIFSHTGVSGSSSHDRMTSAGYDFDGSWRSGENIAYQSERGAPGIEDDVADLHDALMGSPGHRANIMNPNFTQIGIGIETGQYTGSSGGSFDAVMVTQNFAYSVAYNPAPGVDDTPSPEEPASDSGGGDGFDFAPVAPDVADTDVPALLVPTVESVNAACDVVLAGTDFSELVSQAIASDIYPSLCPSNLDGILAQVRDALSDYYGSGGCGADVG